MSDEIQLNYAANLLTKLSSMRNDRNLCDLCLRVNGKDYFCHKFLLIATSDYFRAMFNNSMCESSADFVELKEFQCSSIGFEAMLNFCYSGFLQIDPNEIESVLHAATHLQILEAIRLCSEYLFRSCSLTNCLDYYELADLYSFDELLTFLRSFISKNFIQLYRQAPCQFDRFTFEQIRDEISRDDLELDQSNEYDLFNLVSSWINGNRVEREKFSTELFRLIRFMLIPIEHLIDDVRHHPLIRSDEQTKRLVEDAISFYALPIRQISIENDQNRIRNRTSLVAVGYDQLFTLTLNDDQWKTTCRKPFEETYPYPSSVLTVKNYLYVLGTSRSSSAEYQLSYRFSPRTCQWTKLANLLHSRSRFASAHVDNFIYIFGGFQEFQAMTRVYLTTIDRYSIENDRWEHFASDSPPLSSLAACSIDQWIYFGGGRNSNNSRVADFYRFSIETQQIEVRASMLKPRTSHMFHRMDDEILTIGGFGDDTNGILTIETYNILTDQWTILSSVPNATITTWPKSIGFVDRLVYISVSHSANTFLATQQGHFFDFDSHQWRSAPVVHEHANQCPTVQLRFERKFLC